MRFFDKSKRGVKEPFKYAKSETLQKLVNQVAEQHGSVYCLDIGSGGTENRYYKRLDINKLTTVHDKDGKVVRQVMAHYVGDVRSMFAPGYMDDIDQYPDLLELPDNHWKLISMHHILEHVSWIHGGGFLNWVSDLLVPGGMVVISVPNVEFCVRVYLQNIDKYDIGEDLVYPIHEHPYFERDKSWHIGWWLSFKLFSGGSPGDHHYAAYDKRVLGNLLNQVGFVNVRIYDGETLMAVAYKPGGAEDSKSETQKKVLDVLNSGVMRENGDIVDELGDDNE
jgi:hypothetical protein